MKNPYNIKVLFLACTILLLQSCSSDVLDTAPPDKYTAADIWSDINLADAYLLNSYDGLATGFSPIMMASVTDESRFEFSWGPENYVQGNITADNTRPWVTAWNTEEMHTWSGNFENIQNLNIFLSNIDKVPESYDATEKDAIRQRADVLKGEALFMRAFSYGQLALTFGGVPILTEPNEREDDFQSIERGSFEETINFVVENCEAAAQLLPIKNETEMGRATKAAALALKSRILLFAASDLTADGTSVNNLVSIENPDRITLWTAARDAAKAVMDLGTYNLANFGAPDKAAIAQNYYDFFRQKDLSSNETIWGKMYSKAEGPSSQMNLWNGPNGNNNWAGHNPTQGMVDTYQMEDGTNFSDHFAIDSDGHYINTSDKYESDNPYENREPRFYGSILYDGAVWQPRFPNLTGRDPVGIYDRRTRISKEGGEITSQIYGIDTRKGPVENWNGSFTGYVLRKFLDDEVIGKNENNDHSWIEFRYTEILLNYAEASMELGELGETTTYINMIRNRSGIPDFTGDITEAFRHERKVELAFEGLRWYDLRRWKILEESLTNAMGIDITEITENNSVTTTWERIVAEERNVVPRMYWVPIPTDEINKAPKLEQNPGY